jgi:hypothetical protein
LAQVKSAIKDIVAPWSRFVVNRGAMPFAEMPDQNGLRQRCSTV